MENVGGRTVASMLTGYVLMHMHTSDMTGAAANWRRARNDGVEAGRLWYALQADLRA